MKMPTAGPNTTSRTEPTTGPKSTPRDLNVALIRTAEGNVLGPAKSYSIICSAAAHRVRVPVANRMPHAIETAMNNP